MEAETVTNARTHGQTDGRTVASTIGCNEGPTNMRRPRRPQPCASQARCGTALPEGVVVAPAAASTTAAAARRRRLRRRSARAARLHRCRCRCHSPTMGDAVEEKSQEVAEEVAEETVEGTEEEEAAEEEAEEAPEEEEEEEEVVDPKAEIENSCKPKCVKQLLALQACEKRVEEDEEGQKHCTGQYFDYWGCIDKCAAPKLFRKLK